MEFLESIKLEIKGLQEEIKGLPNTSKSIYIGDTY